MGCLAQTDTPTRTSTLTAQGTLQKRGNRLSESEDHDICCNIIILDMTRKIHPGNLNDKVANKDPPVDLPMGMGKHVTRLFL